MYDPSCVGAIFSIYYFRLTLNMSTWSSRLGWNSVWSSIGVCCWGLKALRGFPILLVPISLRYRIKICTIFTLFHKNLSSIDTRVIRNKYDITKSPWLNKWSPPGLVLQQEEKIHNLVQKLAFWGHYWSCRGLRPDRARDKYCNRWKIRFWNVLNAQFAICYDSCIHTSHLWAKALDLSSDFRFSLTNIVFFSPKKYDTIRISSQGPVSRDIALIEMQKGVNWGWWSWVRVIEL